MGIVILRMQPVINKKLLNPSLMMKRVFLTMRMSMKVVVTMMKTVIMVMIMIMVCMVFIRKK